MRKATSFIVAVVMSVMTLSLPAPAQAHNWIGYGPGFRIGGIELSIFFGQPSYSRYRDYYYRSARPFNYRGHRCSDACFRDGGYYYHHESCPLVAEHFHHYGVRRDEVFDRYAPRYDRYDGYGRYDRYDRRDGYDRYDGYDRRDRDRRDDRDRYGRRYDRDGYRDRRDDRRDRYDRDRYDRHDRGRGRGHDQGRGWGHDRDYRNH
ncbi:MAG TPA: hypothetical protein VHU81_02565 [Thermoanaerobaculia bacterium]|nr:hypothetical protein [Thermoanaerobaculia bacterium]